MQNSNYYNGTPAEYYNAPMYDINEQYDDEQGGMDEYMNYPEDDRRGAQMPQMPQQGGSQVRAMESNYLNPEEQEFSQNYAKGGKVRKTSADIRGMGEYLRQQGNNGDTILAHINPLEANVLKQMGGSGDINPNTGLPQFGFIKIPGFIKNPTKATKAFFHSGGLGNLLMYGPIGAAGISMLPRKQRKWITSGTNKYMLPLAGAMIGGPLLGPGIGGVIGGSLGGLAGAAIGKKKLGEGAMRGGALGAMLPSAASLAGSGATALGAEGLGASLSEYGAQNALLPSLGLGESAASSGLSASETSMPWLNGSSAGVPTVTLPPGASNMSTYYPAGTQAIAGQGVQSAAGQGAAKAAANKGFFATLGDNTAKFFTKPKNIVAGVTAAASMLNRPKPVREKTPEEKADEQKRLEMSLLLTPEERAKREAALLAEAQMMERIEDEKFLPHKRFNIAPRFVKTNTPEEYGKSRKWLSFYDNPDFTGDPVPLKEGGSVEIEFSASPESFHGMHEQGIMSALGGLGGLGGLGSYIQGNTKGQDDKVSAELSDGEYVIPADVVAHMGDGNNAAGAKEYDNMVMDVRKTKGAKNKLPPKAKSYKKYLR